MRTGLALTVVLVLVSSGGPARADTIQADPSNYKNLLGTLNPGDTLQLAAGSYTRLTLQDLAGTASSWITIAGPTSGDPAIIHGESGYNTVQLYNCSFVAVKSLVVDVNGLDVDAINAKDSVSHDILIENNTLRGFPPGAQQIVGINTKSTAWNWVIRHNLIQEPGTGLYLGGSDGSSPFINGVIENNVVLDPVGYCMEIKHQNDYMLTAGMPAGPSTTIIRNNVFIKDDRPSPDGDRPNLLVSGFPDSGPGAMDRYEIYGNFLFYNPRESLFQAAGRVSIHDNVFVGSGESNGHHAILLTQHQGKDLELAHVYNNTIYAVGTGIQISSQATEDDGVVGNLVFAVTSITGNIADLRDNLVDTSANADMYVTSPSTTLGSMDFYPVVGKATGSPLDLSKFAGDLDYDLDFNGDAKGDFSFRGAYAGEGMNPGWSLSDSFKDGGSSTPPSTGQGGSASSSGGGSPVGTGAGGAPGFADPSSDEAGGCSCNTAGAPVGDWTRGWASFAWIAAASLLGRRRARRARIGTCRDYGDARRPRDYA